MKKRILILCLVLVQLLYLFPAFSFAAEQAPTVRVLLTRAQQQEALEVDVYGAYQLNGILAFQRGSQLVFRQEDGTLFLFYQGMRMPLGKEAVLRRFSVEEMQENGLRIHGMMHLLEGDMHISVQDGIIRPVLLLDVEDYVRGVVPFEVPPEYPKEAIKAQAVAARTYALRKLGSSKGYDVVDNTNDQVFRGILADHKTARKYVDETIGEVGMYGKSYAYFYYTASNGGMTRGAEEVWGGEKIPYLTAKEDAWDLKNPNSMVRSAEIPKNLSMVKDHALYQYLVAALVPSIEKKLPNYVQESLQIQTLEQVEVKKVKDNNAMQRAVVLTVNTVFHVKPAGTEQGGDVQHQQFAVTVPLFPTLESMLDISLNGSENEVFEVENTGEYFRFLMRRYGHGVGLSQRGAEQMALEGKNYREILAFYYPGVDIEKKHWEKAALAPLSTHFLATPGPIPTATPRPTLMPATTGGNSKLLYVTEIDRHSTLNLRSSPSLNGKVVLQMYYGQPLIVMEEQSDAWLRVKTDTAEGYVMKKFLSADKPL